MVGLKILQRYDLLLEAYAKQAQGQKVQRDRQVPDCDVEELAAVRGRLVRAEADGS